MLSVALSGFLSVTTANIAAQRTTDDRVYSEVQAKRGEILYRQHCSSCHGSNLWGAESGPPLRGPDFSENWNGLTLKEFFDRIRTTMPRNAPGSLSNNDYLDVIAYILAVLGCPTGSDDLSAVNDRLGGIVIKAGNR
jgi:mono/diheme cytochrome c family protein